MQREQKLEIQKHLLLKNRNDYLLGIARCNALSTRYFSSNITDIIEVSATQLETLVVMVLERHACVHKCACVCT